MSDQHDFDAWHVGQNSGHGAGDDLTRDAGHGSSVSFDTGWRDDEVPEVDAREHDLWGFGSEPGVPSRRGAARARSAARSSAAQRSARPHWLAPVLIIVLAVAALGATWMFTRGSRTAPPVSSSPLATQSSIVTPTSGSPLASVAQSPNSSTTTSSTTSTSTSSSISSTSTTSSSSSSSSSASSSSSSQSSSSSSSASSSSTSSSSSSSSTSASNAAAPASAVSTCGDGDPIGDPSVKLAAGSHSTCAYVAAAAGQVRQHVAQDAAATSFGISPYSAALHRVVPLSCTRANHLTECSGGRGVRLWVTG